MKQRMKLVLPDNMISIGVSTCRKPGQVAAQETLLVPHKDALLIL
jgi:hypothetical protein